MVKSMGLFSLGLSLIFLFSSDLTDAPFSQENPRSIPSLNGIAVAEGTLMVPTTTATAQSSSSPCESPTQRIELRPDLDLQAVIDEAPPGSVLELRRGWNQPDRFRVPETGLVLTKDLALCGSNLFRVELEGPVVPNPTLAREILGQGDGWGSAMVWVAAKEPISVWIENLAFVQGVREENPQPRPPNTYGIVMARQASVTLRNVLLKEHRFGLGVREEAQAVLEDVGILHQSVGIVIRNRSQVELLRVRIAGTSTGMGIEGDSIRVAIWDSWILDNRIGIDVLVIAFPRTVQIAMEGVSIAGNEVGIRMGGAELAPAPVEERTQNWFPMDITLRQSRILSNGIGVIIDRWARAMLEASEVAYNRSDGVSIDAGRAPSGDQTRSWRGGSLVLRGSRVHDNGGYGIVLDVEECGGSRSPEDAFLGFLEVSGSEVFNNREGDLCPENFPWSEGSL